MKTPKGLLILFVATLLLSPRTAASFPFEVGERLEFSISWIGIPAGTAVLEIPEKVEIDGREAFHVMSRSWSNDFVSIFYKVNDRVDGYMDAEDLTSIRLTVRQREGKHRSDKEMIFDRENSRVEFTKNGKKKTFEVPPTVYDSMSALYLLRTFDLTSGSDIKIDTFSNGKLYNVTVKVLGREKVTVAAGTFDTVKVRPILKHNDLFKNRGKIFIWLTDDEYRIPVMVRTKIKIGHITAELSKLEKGGDHGD